MQDSAGLEIEWFLCHSAPQRALTLSTICATIPALYVQRQAFCRLVVDSPGKRLESFRSSLGSTQAQFATALGVSSSAVAFVERDERLPSRAFLQKISARYGISADWLLHGRGAMLASGDAHPVPVRQIDPLLFKLCADLVAQEYTLAESTLSQVEHAVEAARLYNELLSRLRDPSDGDEVDAVLPQLRHLLRKGLASASK